MKNMLFFVLIFILFSSNPVGAACSKNILEINLDDFEFEFSEGKLKAAVVDSNVSDFSVEGELLESRNTKVVTEIVINGTDGEVCKKIKFYVDPLKLCRGPNNDGSIEPWRYRLSTDPAVPHSIISKNADVDDLATLVSSRICGTTIVRGNVYIEKSDIYGGEIFNHDNSSTLISITDSELKGNPNIESQSRNIHLETVHFNGNPSLSDSTSLLDEDLTNPMAVYMRQVEIVGSPNITGGAEGLSFDVVTINGSPTIRGDIGISNTGFEDNGTYSGKAEINGTQLSNPVIDDSQLKGTNNISGYYYISKRIKDSTITGSVARDSSNQITNTAHVAGSYHDFNGSSLTGIGYVAGYSEPGTIITGSVLGSLKHGVLFEESAGAINNSRIGGSVCFESGTADSSTIHGTLVNSIGAPQHITSSTITNSTTSGAPRIIGSTLYESSASGTALIQWSHLGYSSATCDAVVYYEYLDHKSVGCGYPPSPIIIDLLKSPLQKMDTLIERRMTKLWKLNDHFKKLKKSALLKVKKVKKGK